VSGPEHTSLTRTVTLTAIGEYTVGGAVAVPSVRTRAHFTH
jgi:hypothetical protein